MPNNNGSISLPSDPGAGTGANPTSGGNAMQWFNGIGGFITGMTGAIAGGNSQQNNQQNNQPMNYTPMRDYSWLYALIIGVVVIGVIFAVVKYSRKK